MGQATVVKVGPQGRVVIPAEIRRQLDVGPGDELMVDIVDGQLVMWSRAQAVRRLRGMMRLPEGAPSPVDELIAQRRADFEREERELAADARRA
jgi:AbrB family looped-hinge helix DNA binding protein